MPPYPRPMTKRDPFKYLRTSAEIIRLAVMLYVRFPLSLRNVEDLLHGRGVDVSRETIRLPYGCCVAMNSGWDVHATGSKYRNVDEDGVMHFPGVHAETAQMLLGERHVLGLGVDTLSVDIGPSSEFPVHKLWLPSGRWAAEGLANLSNLPPNGATIVVGAPTVVGGSGGPSRIMALV